MTRQFPMNTTNGWIGKNGDLKGIDDQDESSGQYGNYKQAHIGGMFGTEMLGKQNFINPGNMVHNNMGARVLVEQNMEHDVFIDSSFRLFEYYQNPFKFDVKFGGIEAKTEPVTFAYNGETFSYNKFVNSVSSEQYVSGDLQIVIPQQMKNILRLVVHTLIMPKYINFTWSDSTKSYGATSPEIRKSRYLILKMKEINTNYKYSNSPYVDKGSFVMRHDNTRGENDYWSPMCGTVMFHASNLQNIDKLSVEIYDPDGSILYPKLDGADHNFIQEYIDLIKYMKTATDPQIVANLPKLRSLRYITEVSCPEVYISFTGIIPQLDINPRYGNI